MTTTVNTTLARSMSTSKTISTSDPTTTTTPAVGMNLGVGNKTFGAGTSPTGTEAWSGQIALVAGAATIDLSNLTQAGFGTVNATGLKVRAIQVLAPNTNAGAIQIGTGASNGYAELGVLSKIQPGGDATVYNPNAAAIDGTHKTLDLAGTGTDKLNIHIVFGT